MDLAVDADERSFKRAIHSHLRHMLSELTTRQVFLPGAEIQCDKCLASLWYHIDDVRSTIVCRGCRNEVRLRAETPWSYSLNELVATAVRDHGIVPVLRTMYRLFSSSRESFSYMPGVEVRSYSADHDEQFCELDLVWVSDGEFGVGEVKRTGRKFGLRRNVSTILATAVPDIFLVASPSSTDEELQNICSKLDRLNPRTRLEAWGSKSFNSERHMGWNTFVHSLM